MPNTTPQSSGPPAGGSLRHDCVSLVENLAQTVGSMTPSGGISLLIPLVFATAGNGTWLLYIPVAVGYALVAANINIFTSRTASAGSFSTYAELGIGRTAGLIAGWTYFLTLVFAAAECTPSIAYYAASVAAQFGVRLSDGVVLSVLVGSAGAAWWAARRDIALSTNLMLGVESVSLGTMLALAVLFVFHTGHWLDTDQLRLAGTSAKGMRLGLVLVFMSLTGFETVTTLGEEARQPLRTIPRAVMVCIVPISLMYLLMAYVFVLAFKGSGLDMAKTLAPYEHLAAAAGSRRLAIVVGAGVTLSFFACLLGCINAGARVLYSMARRGQFWPSFGMAHPTNATPHRAVGVIGLAAAALPLACIAFGMSVEDCMAYGAQLAGLGFIVTYLWAAVSAPLYLRRLGELRGRHVAVSLGVIAIFGLALVASVYPVPPYPWNVMPYLFAVSLAACVGLSWAIRPAGGPDPRGEEHLAAGAGKKTAEGTAQT